MKKIGLIVGVVMVAMLVIAASEANAQSRFMARHANGGLFGNRTPVYSGTDAEGMTLNGYQGRVNVMRSLKMASLNYYSPQPFYTYSNKGLDAGRTHTWNQKQAAETPWHGDHMNWRWREPTALLVPPTASHQTSYSWGVGQVRSNPIHHQFGRQGAGSEDGDDDAFSPTPYWPWSTEQFGIYPVRTPW